VQRQPFVSVIIVTWNSKKYLPHCLAALSSQTVQNFEVILVDNGSTDGSVDEPLDAYPDLDLHIELLNCNLGFAVANNLGARLARGKWLALLNADAFPEPDWLEKLLQATQNYPDFSCFSSKQIQSNNPDLLDGTGDSYHVSGTARKRNFGYPAKHYGLELEEIFSPCAAAALYLRDAFLEADGFDEDFFSYYEDVDLGFRLRLCGYRSLYVPGAIVHHVGSVTFGVLSDFVFYHTQRNLIWVFFKNMPPSLLWRYLPVHLITNLIYLLYYTLRGRGRVLWKAKLDALRGLPLAFKKRKQIQENRKVSEKNLLHIMERNWLQPFLLGYQFRRAQAHYQKVR
jgi:GT2 family glycosyltransferase